VSDDLIRRFRDKIQARPASGRRAGQGAPPEPPAGAQAPADAPDGPPVPADTVRVIDLAIGPFPGAARLNPAFREGVPRIRLTLDVGSELRARGALLRGAARDGLLALCPRLPDHDCGGGPSIRELLSGDGREPGAPRAVPPSVPGPPPGDGTAEVDGLPLAHLIEHVAIELSVAISGGRRCSGATGAYPDRLDRFDIFLESPMPALGRAVALLATAAVRDLCSGKDRAEAHRRCRDVLALVLASGRHSLVPEDIAADLGCAVPEAAEALAAAGRLGFLEPVPAPFTFSSTTGLLFRRTPATTV
jgi:hypothetical protein